MTQPFKICPHCGQPAVPSMARCARCGGAYEPPQMSRPGRTGIWPVALLLLCIVLAISGAAVFFVSHRSSNKLMSVQDVVDHRRDLDRSHVHIRAYVVDIGATMMFLPSEVHTASPVAAALMDRRPASHLAANGMDVDVPPMISIFDSSSRLHDGDQVEVTGIYSADQNRVEVETLTILAKNALPGGPKDLLPFGK